MLNIMHKLNKFLTMLALLLTVATGAWAEDITVTWNKSDLTNNNPMTKDGVSFTSNAFIDPRDGNLLEGGTFSTTLGNFTKIEVFADDVSQIDWDDYGEMDIWSIDWGTNSATWSGNASSVNCGTIMFMSKIVFTIAPSTVAVTGVTLSQTSASLNVSETVTLTATVAPDDATDKSVTWSSSNTAVATVADGVVTAVAAGTATITVTTTDGSKTATCEVTVPDPATKYDLTVGESAHGTVTFTVDGATATQAKKDDVVTVSVTSESGYSPKDVTVRAYTSWSAAGARRRAPGLLDEIAVTKNETDGTWTFTMPEANVWVVATYTKNLQNAWIQTIADQTYTGEAIEPTVTVKDGETTLVAGTDYTVAYSNNTNAGTATVTVTAKEGSDYSGEATATFTIAKADITVTAPTAQTLTYTGEAQTLVTAGVASFGTVLYSTDGTTYAATLPTGTDAGTYTVYYKVEGDANHNAFSAQTISVTIATNKTALNTAITEAEAYYNSISETNPDAAAVLLEAINAAKTVQGNADATQTEIETATTTLNDAVAAAKADVALKRITLVIPAKSYVARVDADKRTIETAVEGVSLYSVKSVTDSEVELTAALSVVAAEMPYLIYNDTDEEQTISIVVSTDDADAVEYDSEHFKGTLTDKTFTDEDMKAADHYVLQNNNFVWVKDAGTLAAGKCWIELVPASEAHARRLSIVHEGGTTTGINAINAAAYMDGNWYDLSGRRVAQPTKGIYVKNGKKVIVK